MASPFDPTKEQLQNREVASRYGGVMPPESLGAVSPATPVTSTLPKSTAFSNVADADRYAASLGTGQNGITRYTETPATASSVAGGMFAQGGALSTLKPYSASEEEALRKQKRADVQAQVDAINELAQQELTRARVRAQGRLGSGRALSAATGTIGSPIASTRTEGITAVNSAEEAAINAQKLARIQEIETGVENRAADLIEKRKLEATTNAESYMEYLTDTANAARADLTQLAASGVELSPALKTRLIEQTGYDAQTFDELYKSLKIAKSATGEYINKDKPQIVGNKAIFFKQTKDPVTGAVSLTTEELALPEGVGDTKDIEIVYLADGSYAYNKSTEKMTRIGGPKDVPKTDTGAEGQLYSGLSSSTATAVRGEVARFKTEPLVQNFATQQEGYSFARSLSDATKNPADDQALIYSLAKALDPGSVVREGEYATAQKYAQSWIKAYGKGVEQALLGTGFLSQDARKNIKDTIEKKYNASKRSYDNLYKGYVNGIGGLTGRQDGDKFLRDYTIKDATGVVDEEEQLRAEGYSDEQIAQIKAAQ